MKILGIELWKTKAPVGVTQGVPAMINSGNWFGSFGAVLEPFTGAWQRNISCESPKNLTAFAAVYACIDLIARDIAKMRPLLKQQMSDGTWQLVDNGSPFWAPLRKPNFYQTYSQFLVSWITAKLMHGNTYVLKEREEARGLVRRLFVLDPRLVKVLVTADGGVYYELKTDNLSRGEGVEITVPASEIIHDRAITLWHPLIGVPPLYAAAASATQGIRIQNNSAKFFENMSRPSGMLTSPDEISDETALRLKTDFEANFSGNNIGRFLVAGSGLDYKPFTMAPAVAQLIEQLGWTVKDVARPFHMPLYKISEGTSPNFSNFSAMNQDYYSQTLHPLIEDLEVLLSEGLELNKNEPNTPYAVKLDIDNLLRMDPMTRAEVDTKLVTGSIRSPNEARVGWNHKPVPGGDTPYIQQQNWPLSILENRPPPPNPTPVPTKEIVIQNILPEPRPETVKEVLISDNSTISDEKEAEAITKALVDKIKEYPIDLLEEA